MITHVVLFKLKVEHKEENLRAAIDKLRSMVGRVPSLRELEVGENVVPSARAYDLALITRFDDLAGLSAYADDALHVQIKQWLAGVLESSVVVDFAANGR